MSEIHQYNLSQEEFNEQFSWPNALLHSAMNAVASGTGTLFGAGLMVLFGQHVPQEFFHVVPGALMALFTVRSLHHARSVSEDASILS